MDEQKIAFLSAVGTIMATLVGPIAAVTITLWWETVRRNREQRHTVLQTILATRGRYADPGYTWAMRTIPIYFKSPRVATAHADYMNITRFDPVAGNEEAHHREAGRREGILISAILTDLGFRELTDQQLEAYTAKGLATRDVLIEQALRAVTRLADSADRSAEASVKIADSLPQRES